MTSNKKRYFRAAYVRNETATGIGIVEVKREYGGSTIELQSLYIDRQWSNRDCCVTIFQNIRNRLANEQCARLLMHQFQRGNGHHDSFKSRLIVKGVPYGRGITYEAQLLAEDALRRKSDIVEVFDDPLYFSVIQTEQDEREGQTH